MNSNRIQLDIDGMSCGSCVAHVRSALSRLPGVRIEDVQVGRAVVAIAPNFGDDAIRQAITDAGYTLTNLRAADAAHDDAVQSAGPGPGGCCCGGGQEHPSAAPALTRRQTLRHR